MRKLKVIGCALVSALTCDGNCLPVTFASIADTAEILPGKGV